MEADTEIEDSVFSALAGSYVPSVVIVSFSDKHR
jgi:hypothetical protein